MNVFRSLKPVDGRIELCLENLATTSEYTKPASTKDMLLRATSNIAASLQLLDHTGLETFSPMDITSAVYALRAARCVVGEPDISPARLVTLSERYHPLDLLGVGKFGFKSGVSTQSSNHDGKQYKKPLVPC